MFRIVITYPKELVDKFLVCFEIEKSVVGIQIHELEKLEIHLEVFVVDSVLFDRGNHVCVNF